MNSVKIWVKKMSEERYTKDGLPVVSAGTAEVFARDLSRRLCEEGSDSGRTFCNEMAMKVSRENPNLSALYMDFLHGCLLHPQGSKLETSTAYMFGMIVGYEGLRRQAELNNLEGMGNGQKNERGEMRK